MTALSLLLASSLSGCQGVQPGDITFQSAAGDNTGQSTSSAGSLRIKKELLDGNNQIVLRVNDQEQSIDLSKYVVADNEFVTIPLSDLTLSLADGEYRASIGNTRSSSTTPVTKQDGGQLTVIMDNVADVFVSSTGGALTIDNKEGTPLTIAVEDDQGVNTTLEFATGKTIITAGQLGGVTKITFDITDDVGNSKEVTSYLAIIEGEARVGQTLTAVVSDDIKLNSSYQWYHKHEGKNEWTKIEFATDTTFDLIERDTGTVFKVEVKYEDKGVIKTLTSAETQQVEFMPIFLDPDGDGSTYELTNDGKTLIVNVDEGVDTLELKLTDLVRDANFYVNFGVIGEAENNESLKNELMLKQIMENDVAQFYKGDVNITGESVDTVMYSDDLGVNPKADGNMYFEFDISKIFSSSNDSQTLRLEYQYQNPTLISLDIVFQKVADDEPLAVAIDDLM